MDTETVHATGEPPQLEPPQLDVGMHDGSGKVVLTLVGEADIATAPVLREALGVASGNGHSRVVLDLEALEFIDARCLGVLATTQRALAEGGAELVLRSPSPMFARLLGILGWDDWIDGPPTE